MKEVKKKKSETNFYPKIWSKLKTKIEQQYILTNVRMMHTCINNILPFTLNLLDVNNVQFDCFRINTFSCPFYFISADVINKCEIIKIKLNIQTSTVLPIYWNAHWIHRNTKWKWNDPYQLSVCVYSFEYVMLEWVSAQVKSWDQWKWQKRDLNIDDKTPV